MYLRGLKMEEYINIGKFDLNKLSIYSKALATDEVILTAERIEHIKSKHKQQYYELEPYLKEVVENPDYILKEMKHEETIILLKEIIRNELRIKMIIKLTTSKSKI